MRLGVAIEETWDFFREIYADFTANFDTHLFRRRQLASGPFHMRINRAIFRHDMQSFLADNDVVFFEWASELLARASHMPKRCAIVTRLHRYELYQWADRVNWDAVDRIILVSRAKQQEFCRRFPDQAAKTAAVSPSVALDKFTFQPKPFGGNIGILCHLTPRKRVYELILAFSELVAQEPELHLHIAGGAGAAFRDYEEALHYIVHKLGLDDRVTFHGNVTDTQSWYRNIDVFVSHSYSEGLQVAPMEAMASGCCTFAHHWDGAEELVPPQNLYLTDRQLQEKVLEYIALPPDEKAARSAAMRQWACDRFDIQKTIQQVRETVQEAAQQWTQGQGK